MLNYVKYVSVNIVENIFECMLVGTLFQASVCPWSICGGQLVSVSVILSCFDISPLAGRMNY